MGQETISTLIKDLANKVRHIRANAFSNHQVQASNGNQRINIILKNISAKGQITPSTKQMIEEAYQEGHIKDIDKLVEFAKSTENPIQQSYSSKYLGLKDGRFGISTSRLPMIKMKKSSSATKIEYQRDFSKEFMDKICEQRQQSRNFMIQKAQSEIPTNQLTETSIPQASKSKQKTSINDRNIVHNDIFCDYNGYYESLVSEKQKKEQTFIDKDRLINSYSIPRLLVSQKKQQVQSESEREREQYDYCMPNNDEQSRMQEGLNGLHFENPVLRKAFQGYLLVNDSKYKRMFKNKRQNKSSNQNYLFKTPTKSSVHTSRQSSQQLSEKSNEKLMERISRLDKQRKSYNELQMKLLDNLNSSDYYYTDVYLERLRPTFKIKDFPNKLNQRICRSSLIEQNEYQ